MKLSNLTEDKWVNPDQLYDKRGSKTFIFTGDGQLLVGDHEYISHGDLIRQYLEQFKDRLTDVYQYSDGHPPMIADYRESAMKVDLFGRCKRMPSKSLVTFWNKDEQLFNKLLEPCIQALQLKDPVFISSPIHGTIEYTNNNQKTQEPDANYDKMRQLHLMRSDQKKQAMKDLGLTAGSKKSDTQSALEKAGKITPGHKYWAMTSESK